MQEEIEKYSYIPDDKKQKTYTALNIFLIVVIIILFILLIVFSTAFTTMVVEGESMYPTLVDDDKVFLQTYGYKLNRGDLIVFARPNDKNAIKRIIAVGGDTVACDIENKVWIINDTPLEEPYFNGEYSDNYFDKMYDKEAICGEGITVPQGYLFVLGDNRNIKKTNESDEQNPISVDSHIYGPISVDSVIGKVLSVY